MWIVWPFNKKNFGSSRSICADFSSFIDDKMGHFTIRDEKLLPHPKRTIFEAICVLLYSETDEEYRESLRGLAYELAFYQKGVGDRPLNPHGIDTDIFRRADVDAHDLPDLADLPGLARADPTGKERYDAFKQVRDADWSVMRSTIAGITTRPTR